MKKKSKNFKQKKIAKKNRSKQNNSKIPNELSENLNKTESPDSTAKDEILLDLKNSITSSSTEQLKTQESTNYSNTETMVTSEFYRNLPQKNTTSKATLEMPGGGHDIIKKVNIKTSKMLLVVKIIAVLVVIMTILIFKFKDSIIDKINLRKSIIENKQKKRVDLTTDHSYNANQKIEIDEVDSTAKLKNDVYKNIITQKPYRGDSKTRINKKNKIDDESFKNESQKKKLDLLTNNHEKNDLAIEETLIPKNINQVLIFDSINIKSDKSKFYIDFNIINKKKEKLKGNVSIVAKFINNTGNTTFVGSPLNIELDKYGDVINPENGIHFSIMNFVNKNFIIKKSNNMGKLSNLKLIARQKTGKTIRRLLKIENGEIQK